MITRTITQKLVSQCLIWNKQRSRWWKFDVELDAIWNRGDRKVFYQNLQTMLPDYIVYSLELPQTWVLLETHSVPINEIEAFLNKIQGAKSGILSVKVNGRWVSPYNQPE